MVLYADPKRLVAVMVKTEVALNQETVVPNNLKKVVYGLDESPRGNLMWLAVDRGQDLPTYQRSGVAG